MTHLSPASPPPPSLPLPSHRCHSSGDFGPCHHDGCPWPNYRWRTRYCHGGRHNIIAKPNSCIANQLSICSQSGTKQLLFRIFLFHCKQSQQWKLARTYNYYSWDVHVIWLECLWFQCMIVGMDTWQLIYRAPYKRTFIYPFRHSPHLPGRSGWVTQQIHKTNI